MPLLHLHSPSNHMTKNPIGQNLKTRRYAIAVCLPFHINLPTFIAPALYSLFIHTLLFMTLLFYTCIHSIATATKPVTPRLVIEDLDKRKRIVASSHNLSHLGVHRTNDTVSSKYYWPGLFNDVQNYVSCNVIQYCNILDSFLLSGVL